MATAIAKFAGRIPAGAVSSTRPFQFLPDGSVIMERTLFSPTNNTAQNYRRYTTVFALVRELSHIEGPFAAAVTTMVEIAATKLKIAAYDVGSNRFNPKGTNLAKTIMASFNSLHDYNQGFSTKKSIPSTVKMMLREACLIGRVCGELVLNKARFPERLQIVNGETIKMISDNSKPGGMYPAQQVLGVNTPNKAVQPYVPLDIPTFWMDDVHPDPSSAYSRSPMESSIKLLIYFDEFMEDIRRAVRQSGHNRVTMTLDATKVKAAAPADVQGNDPQLLEWMNGVKSQVEEQLRDIAPEDALVMYDMITCDAIQSNVGSKLDYTPLLNVISALLATGMRTPPGVIGLQLDNGAQSSDNLSALVFLKGLASLQTPVETVMSRALTLGCRLFGADVYVEAVFASPNLRPATELEAFYTMEQTRILQQLSIGMITDEQAANDLGLGPLPKGYKKLSGKFFLNGNNANEVAPGSGDTTHPGATGIGRTLQPPKSAPRKGGGKSQ